MGPSSPPHPITPIGGAPHCLMSSRWPPACTPVLPRAWGLSGTLASLLHYISHVTCSCRPWNLAWNEDSVMVLLESGYLCVSLSSGVDTSAPNQKEFTWQKLLFTMHSVTNFIFRLILFMKLFLLFSLWVFIWYLCVYMIQDRVHKCRETHMGVRG